MGNSSSSIIISDGLKTHLFVWGDNTSGQLGLGEGSDIKYNTPQEVTIEERYSIRSISMGYNNIYIILADDIYTYAYSAGDNSVGELGIPDSGDCSFTLLNINNLTVINSTSFRYEKSIAIISVEISTNDNLLWLPYRLNLKTSSGEVIGISRVIEDSQGNDFLTFNSYKLEKGHLYQNCYIQISGSEKKSETFDLYINKKAYLWLEITLVTVPLILIFILILIRRKIKRRKKIDKLIFGD